MGLDHVFDAVGDQLAAGQRVKHTVVTHGNAVVHRNGVELHPIATKTIDHFLDLLADRV